MRAAASAAGANVAEAKTGDLIRTTGERVETGFWSTLNELLLHIPNILAFLLAMLSAWLLGRLLAGWLRRRLAARDHKDLGRLLGSVLTIAVTFVGGLLALSILFPSIDPTSILSLLGVGSIALGFAFRDIFQNLVAGVILLIREPYKTGDEICVGDVEGVVEEVETRATHIRTIDQRLVIIPNVRIFTEAITVNTERSYRMTTYVLALAYGGEPREAMDVVLRAIRSVDSVLGDPPPQVAVHALDDYSIDLLIAYAAGSSELEQITTKSAVLLAIHDACRDNGIALAFPTQVNLVLPYGDTNAPASKLEAMPSRSV